MNLKKIFLVFLTTLCISSCFGQQNFKDSKWISTKTLNLSSLQKQQELSLTKLQATSNSFNGKYSVWTFTEKELFIQNFSSDHSSNIPVIKCSYHYDKRKQELKIFHSIHDSSFWNYSVSVDPSKNTVLLGKKE